MQVVKQKGEPVARPAPVVGGTARGASASHQSGSTGVPKSEWEKEGAPAVGKRSRWDQSPTAAEMAQQPRYGDQPTPQHTTAQETPTRVQETPTPRRWGADQTPMVGKTPMLGM